ncbi:MAG: PulJ/GspJ family protein [Candidatus Komeilibacteria bacterium]
MKKNQTGLTLVEVIIYITIVSMILTVAVFFAWDVIGGQTKSYVITEVNQNSRFILNSIAKDMRQAVSINSVTEDSLSVDLIDGSTITYMFNNELYTLSRQLNTDDPIILHSDVIVATGVWQDLSTSQSSSVSLDLTVAYNSTSNHTDWQSSLSTSISFNLNLE